MIDLIRTATTLQFVLGIIWVICTVMILLQAILLRGVSSWYLLGFFGSAIGLAMTLR